MVERRSVRGVVLAGGESRRFGEGDKALADLDGRPLLAHIVEAVEATTGGTPILAVASDEEGARLTDAMDLAGGDPAVVTDDPSLAGPLAGLLAAARRAETPWLLVCGCDMPLVTPEAFTALRDRAGSTDADAVVPVVGGHRQPLHALYRRGAVLDVAPRLPQRGPSALLDEVAVIERVDAAEVDAPLADAVTNVNTRADLERVRERSPGGH